jgi:hypothetical protein
VLAPLFAPLLLALAMALGTLAACQDDSVYRSGDPPPSAVDSGVTDDASAPGDTDGGTG